MGKSVVLISINFYIPQGARSKGLIYRSVMKKSKIGQYHQSVDRSKIMPIPLIEYQVALRHTLQQFQCQSFFSSSVAERTKEWNKLDKLWDPLCAKFAWACPDERALKVLCHFSPLVEIGAGKGYWALLLQQRGADIVCYDKYGGDVKGSSVTCWTKVRKGGPEKLTDASAAGRNLFLCFPDEEESIAIVCLESFSGEFVIHVGELLAGDGTCGSSPQAPWGRTTSAEFQIALAATFHCVYVAKLETRLPFARDCISVWKRTKYVLGRHFPAAKSKKEQESDEGDEDEDYSESEEGESYADFNRSYFASVHEQEKMLADKVRMSFYHSVVNRLVKPGSVVLDLGTGTGILAAFAERAGAAKIYAVDHSKSALAVARKVAAANKLDKIEWIQKHSSKFELPGKGAKVDVILHEQMGDCLFDEDMVKNVCDVRDRLLRPGGLIVPSCFDLFVEPVRFDDKRHVPFVWDLNVHGIDFSCLKQTERLDDDYYHLRSCDPHLVESFLCKPEPIFSIDLHTVLEGEMPLSVSFSRTVINASRYDGFVVYFRTRASTDLSLSTGPHDPNRAPHWGYRILRDECDTFEVGDSIDVTLVVKKWAELNTWRWSHTRRPKGGKKASTKTTTSRSAAAAAAAAAASEESSASAVSFVSLKDLALLRGESGSKRKAPQTEDDHEDENENDEDVEEDEEKARREMDLDQQYHETDDKTWAAVAADELMQDRCAPSYAFLL